VIEEYAFGRLVVDGRTYSSDLIIYPDRVEDGWWRKEGHRLGAEDLEAVLAASPEVLVVGQGQSGLMRVSEEVRRVIEAQDIEFLAAPTGEAVEHYNRLAPRRRVVAALHLTC